MSELEIAFVGLVILLGAGAIVYSGIRLQTPKPASGAARNTDGAPPVVVLSQNDNDSSSSGDGGAGGGDGGAA